MSGRETGTKMQVLDANGVHVPDGFPADAYAAAHGLVTERYRTRPAYSHFAGSWNAVAYRCAAAHECATSFRAAVASHGTTPPPAERYQQERLLFDFYANAFSALEASFYGMYAVGVLIGSVEFSLLTARDEQRVSPTTTLSAYARAFPSAQLVADMRRVTSDLAFVEVRATRNVLTHRVAPGRLMFVTIGGEDEAPPTQWKLNDKPITEVQLVEEQRELERVLTMLIDPLPLFIENVET